MYLPIVIFEYLNAFALRLMNYYSSNPINSFMAVGGKNSIILAKIRTNFQEGYYFIHGEMSLEQKGYYNK